MGSVNHVIDFVQMLSYCMTLFGSNSIKKLWTDCELSIYCQLTKPYHQWIMVEEERKKVYASAVQYKILSNTSAIFDCLVV